MSCGDPRCPVCRRLPSIFPAERRRERWVNAEIKFTIPLDVPVTASVAEKAAAAEEIADRYFPEMPQDAVATIGFRDVENAKPIGGSSGS